MNLAMAYFFDENEQKIPIARQLGVRYAVTNIKPGVNTLTPEEAAGGAYDFAPFYKKVKLFDDAGLIVSVIESPTPLEMTKLGLPGRDREIEIFLELFRILDEKNIRTICYNWMPVVGWFRTNTDIQSRGGARVTGYRHEDGKKLPPTEYGVITAEKMWANLEYFLKAVVPEAERLGINLAVHPDDPPVESLRGIARILTSFEAFKRVIELVPSPVNGMTMCQGSFGAMGEDPLAVIEYFGTRGKLFFAHFRDIRGDKYDFVETFHDDGPTDMYACMKKYAEVGFDGCIRPDHVPAMIGEANEHPGYSTMGNLFAIGYMRGLMEAAGKERLTK